MIKKSDDVTDRRGRIYNIPLHLQPQPEGGYTVTSPAVPGLVTEGETIDESVENAWDALLCLLEGYEAMGRATPLGLPTQPDRLAVRFEYNATPV